MTLNQSALLELTEVLRSADGGELIRQLALTMLQALVDAEATARIGAGVARGDIHVDHASGAKASRPKLDLILRILRDGDVLVVTRLDRLGRSVLHLVTLGAQLRERGVGRRILRLLGHLQLCCLGIVDRLLPAVPGPVGLGSGHGGPGAG